MQYIKTQGLLIDTEKNEARILGNTFLVSSNSVSMMGQNSNVDYSVAIKPINSNIGSGSISFNSESATLSANSIDFNSKFIVADKNSVSFANSYNSNLSSSIGILGTNEILNSSISLFGKNNTISLSGISLLSQNLSSNNRSFTVLSDNVSTNNNVSVFNTKKSKIENNSFSVLSENITALNDSGSFNSKNSYLNTGSFDINGSGNTVNSNSISIKNTDSNISNNSFGVLDTADIVNNNSVSINGNLNTLDLQSVNILSTNTDLYNKSFSVNSTNSTLVNNALAFNTIGSGVSSSSIDFNGVNNTSTDSSINILSDNNIVSNKSFAVNASNTIVSSNSEAFNTKNSTLVDNSTDFNSTNSTLVNNALAFNTVGSGVSSSSIDFNGINNTTSTSGINILSENNIVSNKSFAVNSSNNTVFSNSEAFNTKNSTLVNNALAFNTVGSGVSSSSIDFNGVNNTTSTSGINILSDNNRVSNKSFAVNSSNNNVSSNSEAFNTINSNILNNSIEFNGSANTSTDSSINILSNNNRVFNKSFSVNSSNNTVSSNSLAFNTINSGVSSSSIDFNGVGNTSSVSSINILSDNNKVSNKSFAVNSSNNNISSNSEAFNTKNSTLVNNSTDFNSTNSTLVNNALAFNTVGSGVSSSSIDFNGVNNTSTDSSINILSDNNRVSNKSFAVNSTNNTVTLNSEAFNTKNSTLVNNALAFNSVGSGVSSNSIDFNGVNNTTSTSGINILSDNNIVSNKSFAVNASNTIVSSNSEAFNTKNSTLVNNSTDFNSTNSTLVNNALAFNTIRSNVSSSSIDINGFDNISSLSSINIFSDNNRVFNKSFAVNSSNNTVSSNSEAFSTRNSTLVNNALAFNAVNSSILNDSIDFNGVNNTASTSGVNILSDNNRVFDKSFAINSSNNTVSSNSEAFSTRNSTLVNNALAFNTVGSGVSSSSIDFNGVNNTTSTSGINILSDNNIVFDKSFAVNSSNNTISSNSEAFSTRNSTLVNNALAFNAVDSNVLNNSISINSTGVNSNNKTLDIFGTTNNISNSSISINSFNTTTNDRSLSINTTNSTVSSRSFSIGSNNSTVILSSIDLFGSNNNLQNTSIGFAGSNVVSTKGNTNFIGTKNSELNSTNSLAIGGTNITQSLCANNTSTGNNILTIGGNSNKVGSNSLVIGGTNNLISNNSVSIGGSNNNTSTYSNILMLNVNNTTADRSNLVYLPATYVTGDIIVNGKLSASGGVFEIDKSILASDSAIRINNTFSPSAALVIEQGNASYNIAEFKFGLSKKPVFYIGSDGVSVNTGVLNPSNALTVNGDISANKNINLINSSVLNIGDTNLYRSATNTIKTDDNFVVGTLATSTTDNSVIVENSGTLRKRTINNRIWDTNATFLSGVGLTTNNLPKAEGPNKLVPSNISDNLGVVSINVPTRITGYNSLQLEGLTHTYIEWYPQTLANGRKSWTGFSNTGDNRFSIVNEITNGSGHINLIPGQNANVGISNNPGFVPSKLLTITGVASASNSTFNGGTTLFRIQGSTAQFSEPALEFAELSLSPTARIASKNVANGGGDLIFLTRNSSSSTSSLLERLRITGDGNVGIGTSSPSTKLEISGAGNTGLRITSTDNQSPFLDFFRSGLGNHDWRIKNDVGNGLRIYVSQDNLATETHQVSILTNGNVGIGNTNPTALLSFPNTIGTRKITLFDATNNGNQFYGFGVEGNTLVYSVDTFNADHVFFSGINSTSRRELFRIMGDGAVSLSAGNINLSNNYGLYWSANTDAASVRFESTGDLTGQSKLILETMDNSDEPIVLRQAGSDRMYIGTGGRIGIGTGSPVAKLDINSLVINEPVLFLKPPSGTFGNRSILGMWSTFSSASPADYTIRRTADIVAGFSTNNWGNEYLSFNVGFNGINNDGAVLTSEKVRINASGNVGIGTSTPIGKLSVYDSTNADINLQYGTNSLWWITANQAGLLKIGGNGASRPASGAINITSTGNVGIGTTDPLDKLSINGNISLTSSVASIKFSETTTSGIPTTDGYVIRYEQSLFGSAQDGLVFEKTDFNSTVPDGGVAFTNRGSDGIVNLAMAIRGTGRVGIGTDNPYTGLHVKGTQVSDDYGIVIENTSQTGYSSIVFGSENPVGGLTAGIWRNGSSVTGYAGASSLNIGSSINSTNIGFITNNTTRMIVLSSGNIGIRTLTPNTALTVNGDLSSNSQVFARGITITPSVSSDTTPDLTLVSPNNSLDATWFYNNLTTGSYNPLSQIGDKGIIFSSNTSQTEGNMIIGPWSSQQRGIVIDGINGRVGINKRPTLNTFDVNGTIGSSGNLSVSGGQVYVGRQNSAGEGGEIALARSSDNKANWYIDSLGTTATPNLRFFNEVNNVGTVRMTIDGLSGNVGIGNFSGASFPLSFGATLGNKIGLYDAGSGNGFGFGIQGSILQIFSQTSTSRVGIGYGNSSAFTETLTVRGENVGIGFSNPTAKLSISRNTTSELTGLVSSQIFKINGSTLGSNATNKIKLASIGFTTGSDSVSLGFEALRVSGGSDSTSSAIGIKLDITDSSPDSGGIWFRPNGCIGIGTSSPASKLTVSGAISSNANILFSEGTTSNNGLVFGSDTNLYRSGTNTLKTDDNFIVGTLATSTSDNNVIVENSGILRKRTINSRVWDTAATFLSGSGTVGRLAMHTGPSTIGNSTISDTGINTVFSRQAMFDVPAANTSLTTPQLAFNSTNNGLYYNNTDGLMTTIGGLEKFRVNANYVFVPNKLGVGTTSIGTEKLNVAGSIKYGSMSFPSFEGNIDYGSDGAGTWRKLINASLQNTQYSTIGFVIEITDPRTNHASSDVANATVETIKFNVACLRSQATTLDSPNACYVSGPISGMIRAVRLSTGNYEIQIASRVLYQEYYVKIYAYASNGGHTIDYFGGTTATVVTTQPVYNSTGGQKIEYFDKGIFTGTGDHDVGHYLQLKEIAAGNNNGPKILFEKNSPIKRWSIGSAKGASENGFGIYEGSSTTAEGTNRLYFAAGGNVGIGQTNPLTKLSIYDSTNADINLQYGTDNLWWITANQYGVLKIGGTGASRPVDGAINITSTTIKANNRLNLTSEDAFVSYSGTINAYQFSCNGQKSNIIRIKETVSRTFENIVISGNYDNTIYTIINDSPNFVNFSFSSAKGYLRVPGGTRTIGQGECCSMMHWKNGIFSIF